ncbi:MAG: ComEC/Rec2 family competence protein [Candidatus Melainabacteria bacterium]|nr:ComEC/Rec2 family competence protein [Candidatus Melainabacteria bacterium]
MLRLTLPLITVVSGFCAAAGCFAGVLCGRAVLTESATAGSVSAGPGLLLFGSVLIASSISCLGRRRICCLVALVVAPGFFASTLCRYPQPCGEERSLSSGHPLSLACRLERVDTRGRLYVKPIAPAGEWRPGTIMVYLPRSFREHPPLVPGTMLRVRGQARPVLSGTRHRERSPPAKQRRRDWELRLYEMGIYSKVFCYRIEILEPPASLSLPAEAFAAARQAIVAGHRANLGGDLGDLLSSIVLGDRTVRLSAEIKETFRVTGLSHLLAASGFNLSILVAAVYFSVALITRNRLLISLIALAVTAGFVGLAGPSASVVRAAIMVSFLILARLSFRRLHGGAALAATLMVALALDPLSIVDVGMQLSYAATAAIVGGIGAVDRLARGGDRDNPDGADAPEVLNSLPVRIRRWLIDSTAVIVLAQSGVLPLQLYYFERLGLLFLPANLLIEPVVAPLTVAGFLSSACLLVGGAPSPAVPFAGLFSGLSFSLDWLASFLLRYMIALARYLAGLEWATIEVEPVSPQGLVVYYLCLAFFLFCLSRQRQFISGALVLLVGLSILFL